MEIYIIKLNTQKGQGGFKFFQIMYHLISIPILGNIIHSYKKISKDSINNAVVALESLPGNRGLMGT